MIGDTAYQRIKDGRNKSVKIGRKLISILPDIIFLTGEAKTRAVRKEFDTTMKIHEEMARAFSEQRIHEVSTYHYYYSLYKWLGDLWNFSMMIKRILEERLRYIYEVYERIEMLANIEEGLKAESSMSIDFHIRDSKKQFQHELKKFKTSYMQYAKYIEIVNLLYLEIAIYEKTPKLKKMKIDNPYNFYLGTLIKEKYSSLFKGIETIMTQELYETSIRSKKRITEFIERAEYENYTPTQTFTLFTNEEEMYDPELVINKNVSIEELLKR